MGAQQHLSAPVNILSPLKPFGHRLAFTSGSLLGVSTRLRMMVHRLDPAFNQFLALFQLAFCAHDVLKRSRRRRLRDNLGCGAMKSIQRAW